MSHDSYAPSSSTATSSGLHANVNDGDLGQSMEWSANVEMANGGSHQNVEGGGRSKRSRDRADNEQGAAPARSAKRRRGTPVVPTRSSPRLREQRERKRRQQLSQRQQQQQQQYQLEREQQQHVEQVQQQQRQQRHQQRVLRQQQLEQQQQEQQLQLELQQQQQQQQQEQQRLQEEQEQLEQQAQAQEQEEARARRTAIDLAENQAIVQAQLQTEPFLAHQQGEEWLRLFNTAQQVRQEEHQYLDLGELEFVERRIADELVSRQQMQERLRDHRLREQRQGLGDDTFPATLLNHVEVTIPLLESEIEQLQTRIDESRYLPFVNFSEVDQQIARVDDGCSICLEEFLPDQLVCTLRCGHTFHGECLQEWLSSSVRSSRACPNCRILMIPVRGQDA